MLLKFVEAKVVCGDTNHGQGKWLVRTPTTANNLNLLKD